MSNTLLRKKRKKNEKFILEIFFGESVGVGLTYGSFRLCKEIFILFKLADDGETFKTD